MVLRRFSTLLVAGLVVTVSVVLYLVLSTLSRQLDTGDNRTAELGLLVLEIPAGFVPCKEEIDNDWHINEYCTTGGTSLQLAWAEGDPDQYAELAVRYFSMPDPLVEGTPVRYRAHGSWWMVRALPVGEGGAYAIRTRGKGRVATVFFGAGNRLYWISLRTGSSLSEEFELLHGIIRSITWDGHALSGSRATQIMERTCRDGYYLFCQPLWFLSVLPLLVGLLILAIMNAVGRRMGRIPDIVGTDGRVPVYQEADVDASMSSKGKTSVVRVGLLVYPDAMVLTMFGRPRIRISHDSKNGVHMSSVKGFLGHQALEIEGEARNLVVKRNRFSVGKWKIRIYCDDPDRVLAYFG